MTAAHQLNPLSLPGPVFTFSEALEVGMTRGKLRGPGFTKLRHGLFATADAEYTDVDIVRALCRQDPHAVVVGPTAARMLAIPVPRSLQVRPLHLATSPQRRPRPDALLRWSRRSFAPADIMQIDGVRLTTRVRTWADLGEHLSVWGLVVAADHLVRIPRPRIERRTKAYATVEMLAKAADSSLRAATRLREALPLVRVGSDSPMETRLRLHCHTAGLPEPELNPSLLVPGTHVRHEPDLLWRDHGVSVQYDSAVHRTPEQQVKDIRRAERARQLGLHEVIITQADMHDDGQSAVDRIGEALHESTRKQTG